MKRPRGDCNRSVAGDRAPVDDGSRAVDVGQASSRIDNATTAVDPMPCDVECARTRLDRAAPVRDRPTRMQRHTAAAVQYTGFVDDVVGQVDVEQAVRG